jgi:hypothetical protein
MNRTARVVPGLPRGDTTRLTALDTKLNGTLDHRAVTISRMGVASAGAAGSDCYGEYGRFLALIAFHGALE